MTAVFDPSTGNAELAARLQKHADYLDAEGCQGSFAKDLADAARLLGAAQGQSDRGEIGVLESNPALFNILNDALGTMHYHRLMSALNLNGYQIVPTQGGDKGEAYRQYLVGQHIGWLKQYVEGTTADNWQDMRLRAERQLEQLCKDLDAPAYAAWQPIETAPKDKPIMLCVDGWLPCTGRWWPMDSCWMSFDWDGHFESDKEASDYAGNVSYEPTHWMPLPAGPSVSSTMLRTPSERTLQDIELADNTRKTTIEECCEIVQAIDSGRGNEKVILEAIRALAISPAHQPGEA